MKNDRKNAKNTSDGKNNSPFSHPSQDPDRLLPPRGDYQTLLSFQKAEIVYDLTFRFAHKFLAKGDRTVDQMIQSARSGKKNILEGSKAALTSKETEIKLINVARASLEELLDDYKERRCWGISRRGYDEPSPERQRRGIIPAWGNARATPQERRAPRDRGLKARANRRAVGSGFQPLGIFGLVTQGVALGWYESGALPLQNANDPSPIAALDAESPEVLGNIKALL